MVKITFRADLIEWLDDFFKETVGRLRQWLEIMKLPSLKLPIDGKEFTCNFRGKEFKGFDKELICCIKGCLTVIKLIGDIPDNGDDRHCYTFWMNTGFIDQLNHLLLNEYRKQGDGSHFSDKRSKTTGYVLEIFSKHVQELRTDMCKNCLKIRREDKGRKVIKR
jgi:hypothetical protein